MEIELKNSGFLSRAGLSLEQTHDSEGHLAEYIHVALTQNPLLLSGYSNFLATMETVSQVSALPDLKLGYTEYLHAVETRVGPQERAFFVSQSFPWFGMLALQGEIQKEKAEAVRSQLFSAVLKTVADVKKAYYDIGYQEQAIRITEEHVRLMTQWEDVARARYRTGTVQYSDVIKSQVELGILADRLEGLRDRRRPLLAAMNALLGRDSASPVVVTGIPPFESNDPQLNDLVAKMKTQNPLLVAWDHRARESLKTDRLAKKQGYPSFSLGLNYIMTGEARMDGVSDSGQDALMASLAVNVPIWRGKYKAASRSAVHRYQAALSSKQDLANNLESALENVVFQYRDAHRKWRLYDTTLLPKGHQSLGATRSAYEAGQSSFLDLMDAQRMVLEFELSQARAAFDILIHQSEIEKIVGSPLSPKPELIE